MQTIAWAYQVGLTTVHTIILEVCKVLWEVLSPVYLKPPQSSGEWIQIAEEYNRVWNFPFCVGALDGKHINIQAPAHSGSLYYNYKHTYSIVLLAACDADYNFTLIDVGAYGSQSDGGVFSESVFGEALRAGELNLPNDVCLPQGHVVSYTFVADAAFPLQKFIMRPYPGKHLTEKQRIFNYRLSRARRTIENAFGIMVARWRLLKQHICANVDNVDSFVKAIVCLHNYVKKENVNDYCPPEYVDTDDSLGTWRSECVPLKSVSRMASNNHTTQNKNVRNSFADYFTSPEGQLPWQLEYVRRGSEPV